jgi:hypothetical protein
MGSSIVGTQSFNFADPPVSFLHHDCNNVQHRTSQLETSFSTSVVEARLVVVYDTMRDIQAKSTNMKVARVGLGGRRLMQLTRQRPERHLSAFCFYSSPQSWHEFVPLSP